MKGFLDLLHGELGQRLTWTLLHFVWQGLAIALLLAALLWILRVRKAHVRYAFSILALLLMVACLPATFVLVKLPMPNPTPVLAETASSRQLSSQVDVNRRVERHQGEAEGHYARLVGSQGMPQSTIPVSALPVNQNVATSAGLPANFDFPSVLSFLQPYMLLLWGLGVMFLSVRLLLGLACLSRVKAGGTPVTVEITRRISRLTKRLGLTAIPPAFSSLRVAEAVAIGFFKPMILIPAAWLAEMTPDMLEAVIAHELAHIRRWDLWVNLVQRFVETLLFYHPAVWWLSRRIRQEREMCCDELAVSATGQRLTYVDALQEVVRRRVRAIKPTAATVIAIGGTKMAILERVRNLLGGAPAEESIRWWPVGILTMLLPILFWFSPALGTSVSQPASSSPVEMTTNTDAQEQNPPATGTVSSASDPAAKQKTAVVRGHVVNDAQVPIAGADIWLVIHPDGALDKRHVAQTKAGSDGQFQLEFPNAWLSEWPYSYPTVWAYAPGRSVSNRNLFKDNAANLTISLGRPSKTSFLVLRPDGKPLVDATVAPYYFKTLLGCMLLPQELLPLVSQKTDAQGHATLSAIPAADCPEVKVSSDEFGVQCIVGNSDETSAQMVFLRPVGRIEGRLVADKPELASHVPVVFRTLLPSWGSAAGIKLTYGMAEVVTDREGRFVVPSITSGDLDIAGIKTNFSLRPRLAKAIKVEEESTTTIDIPLVSKIKVEGQVYLRGTKHPASNVTIEFFEGDASVAADVSDAEGKYTSWVFPGKIRFGFDRSPAKPPKYVALADEREKVVEVPADVKTFELPALEAVPSRSFSGQLIDENDKPVTDVRLNVSDGKDVYGDGQADRCGNFVIHGIPESLDPASISYNISLKKDSPVFTVKGEAILTDPLIVRVRKGAGQLVAEPAQPAAPSSGSIQPPSPDKEPSREMWPLGLKDAVRCALQNSKVMRQLGAQLTTDTPPSTSKPEAAPSSEKPTVALAGHEGRILFARKNTDISLIDFEAAVRNQVADVEAAYWELYFYHHSLDAVVKCRDQALETWQKVHGRQQDGKATAAEEAQAREQYYLFRSTGEQTLMSLHETEKKLRYLMGVAETDGRLIRPSDEPATAKVAFDWAEIMAEALRRNIEIRRQQLQVKRHELERNAAQEYANSLGDKRNVGLRNAELALAKDRAQLKEAELELSHATASAVHNMKSDYELADTNFNRRVAAEANLEAVKTAYEAGSIQIDVLLKSQRLHAQAESDYYRAAVNYVKSVAIVHFRKGSLLEYLGVCLADESKPDQ